MKKILISALLLVSSLSYADSTRIKFIDGWIKQLPPVVPMRAGYLQIDNPSDQPVEIIAINSEAFERVEMHETMMADGVMKMVEQSSMVVPPKGSLELKPGGKHLMLIAPLLDLQIGDTVDLTVTFSDRNTLPLQLEVRQ